MNIARLRDLPPSEAVNTDELEHLWGQAQAYMRRRVRVGFNPLVAVRAWFSCYEPHTNDVELMEKLSQDFDAYKVDKSVSS